MSSKRPSASQGGERPPQEKISMERPYGAKGVKGKEKQAVGELYELFDNLASELWPEAPGANGDNDSDVEPDEQLSIEAQIANEVSAMKRPKKEQRFTNCQTNTPCVVFISCKPPIDPVKLVETHLHRVQATGVTHTRHSLRFSPVAASVCHQSPRNPSPLPHRIRALFWRMRSDKNSRISQYKIELRIRNHTTITRPELIEAIAKCVPEGHTVDLDNAELFILVEVFKSVCGVSVVRDYSDLQKFNAVEIANKHTSAQAVSSISRIE
ncbi:hypothetical protein B0H11DRAFT_250134 [Mycena galericulata]|nr:hypothetical protein B0H11DRAFT_250134 [Mycena galericulata]